MALPLQSSAHAGLFLFPQQAGVRVSAQHLGGVLINASFQPSARKSQPLQLEAKYVNLLSLSGGEPASLQLLFTTATAKLNGDI